jgi:pantoate--beta-alanine ligase
MQIFTEASKIRDFIRQAKKSGQTVGFVPTMGALHDGHLSLIQKAGSENDLVISSIFINPTQFNNPLDFEKYPVTIDQDIANLEKQGCHLLFLPTVNEIYPVDFEKRTYLLGELENILEGPTRPGHFQGVCMVVERLLELIPCHRLYLGEKDYQQCLVIQTLLNLNAMQIEMVICPTIRESDGLAMSSRNLRLSESERKQASQIHKTLLWLHQNLSMFPPNSLINQATRHLESAGFRVDYVALTNNQLMPIQQAEPGIAIRALIAAHLNEIRLIDNMLLQEQPTTFEILP